MKWKRMEITLQGGNGKQNKNEEKGK